MKFCRADIVNRYKIAIKLLVNYQLLLQLFVTPKMTT